MKLSVLDQSPARSDGTAAEAVAETIALAKAAERLGYHRYWLAEHHNTKSFAGSAPEVLIARVAAETKTIRVGSGGVMLTHYSPLKVAEQFRMLEILSPGRIDLGLGRAPGTDQRTAQALQAGLQGWGIDAFPSQVHLLRQFLDDAAGTPLPDDHPYRGIHATPMGPTRPEMWLLGSGIHSAVYAGELGLPFAHAHFISAEGSEEACDTYRRRFKPSTWCESPAWRWASRRLRPRRTRRRDGFPPPAISGWCGFSPAVPSPFRRRKRRSTMPSPIRNARCSKMSKHARRSGPRLS